MTPVNGLICRVALETGLRIDDVCALTTEQLYHAYKHSGWLVVIEQKTDKHRRIRLAQKYMNQMLFVCGQWYVFPNGRDGKRHRTRQAVWRELRQVGRKVCGDGVVISPHSLRKCFAVCMWDKTHDLERVKKALNHDNVITTMWYINSRELTENKQKKGAVKR